jgi:hypothetical protein
MTNSSKDGPVQIWNEDIQPFIQMDMLHEVVNCAQVIDIFTEQTNSKTY